jgi:DNA polymerase elongation subunit (family B)
MAVKKVKIESVKQLENFNNEYVYDIGIDDPNIHNFFANDILVHNSCYFSAYKPWKDNPDIEFDWNDENAIVDLYDNIAAEVNSTFDGMMSEAFHVDPSRSVIKAGREIVAESGLWMGKKQYCCWTYDKEGKKPQGMDKLKITGLAAVRSDSPPFIKEMLKDVLVKILTKENEEQLNKFVNEFVASCEDMPPWRLGSPKGVNNIDYYQAVIDNGLKCPKTGAKVSTIPGHVRAALNFNRLKRLHTEDKYTPLIPDGAKIIVSRLKNNNMSMDSIAVPTDLEENKIPEWFKELPFDREEMIKILVETKVQNIFDPLKWTLNLDSNSSTASSLFDWD